MKKNRVITIIAAIAATASMASASFSAKYVNESAGLVTGGVVVGGVAQTAGHLQFEYVGTGGRGAGQYASGRFSGFCLELQNIQGGTHTYDVDLIQNAPNPEGGSGVLAYDAADEAEVHAVLAAAIGLGWINSDLSLGSADANKLAAIQGMVWKVVFDGGSTSDPNYVLGGTATIQGYMDQIETIANSNPSGHVNNLEAMLNATTQDQLFVIAPLPTAVFAGLITLGGIGGISRSRRR